MYKIASLVEHFHLTLPEINNLTERQIDEIYFYPRDKDGSLIAPVSGPAVKAKFSTFEDDLEFVEVMHQTFKTGNYEEQKKKVYEKWGREYDGK